MSYEEFRKKVSIAISELRKAEPKKIILVYHDDADGLCSGAIMKAALEGESYEVRAFCLEKNYPEVVEELHKGKNETIFYSDIGSAHADFLSQINSGRNLTIILDHHNPTPSQDPRVHDLNLEHFGFQGETDFSGATCNYLFAKALNEHNVDFSYLALVGSREIPGNYSGLNLKVLEEAKKNRVVKVEGKNIKIVKLGIRVDDLFAKLQILGAVGYYDGGPELGIQVSLEGITDRVKEKLDEWEEKRKSVNKQLILKLYRERLKETMYIQWFDAGDMYKGMGTKVIGQFCSFLSYHSKLIKANKYIMGFVNVSPEVPGWGNLKGELVKVSIRVPKGLHTLIDQDKMLGAVELLVKASKGFGVVDGHKYAANVVIPAEKKEVLINNADKFPLL
jgi:single-stranded DNA-specific DHH superfamily exonuclease